MSSPAESKQSAQFENPHSFQVSGLDINCGPVLVLPAICVVTGDRIDIAEVKTSFMYRSPFVIAIGPICLVAVFLPRLLPFPIGIIALMGPIYWLVYYVFRRGTHRCHVTYFLSKKIFARKRLLKVAAAALLLGSIAVFWHGVTMNRVDMTPLFTGILLMLAAALTYHFSKSPLSAAAFGGKRLFRIHGFAQAFHETGRAMYAAASASSPRPKKIQREIKKVNHPGETPRTPRPNQET